MRDFNRRDLIEAARAEQGRPTLRYQLKTAAAFAGASLLAGTLFAGTAFIGEKAAEGCIELDKEAAAQGKPAEPCSFIDGLTR